MTLLEAQAIAWPDPTQIVQEFVGYGRDRPRFYRHLTEGWFYPGVTTVLQAWDKSGLIKWAADLERESVIEAAETVLQDAFAREDFRKLIEAKLGPARAHQKAKDAAADIGKAAHLLIQHRLMKQIGEPMGPEPRIPDESMIAVLGFEKLWAKSGITPVRCEQVVVSHNHRIAGTADLIALRDGKLGLIDLKSSKRTYQGHHMQAAAYADILFEMGVPIEWVELWRLPKRLDDPLLAGEGVEIVPLGEISVWNGRESVARTETAAELFQSFLGIARAWNCTMRPA